DRTVQDGPACHEVLRCTSREGGPESFDALRTDRVQGADAQLLAVKQEEPAEHSVAQRNGPDDYCVQDWLKVSRRRRDHPQDLARRRLLLERPGESPPELGDLLLEMSDRLKRVGRLGRRLRHVRGHGMVLLMGSRRNYAPLSCTC